MRRLLAAFALSAALIAGGCQHPDGSTDWGSTLLLGAGVGTAAALIAGAASDNRPRHYAGGHGYRHSGYGHGFGQRYGQGYGYGPRGHRGW